MTTGKGEREESVERKAALADQGQRWQFKNELTAFVKPPQIFDRPLEITIAQLRGLRMVDETVVVHGNLSARKDGTK